MFVSFNLSVCVSRCAPGPFPLHLSVCALQQQHCSGCERGVGSWRLRVLNAIMGESITFPPPKDSRTVQLVDCMHAIRNMVISLDFLARFYKLEGQNLGIEAPFIRKSFCWFCTSIVDTRQEHTRQGIKTRTQLNHKPTLIYTDPYPTFTYPITLPTHI